MKVTFGILAHVDAGKTTFSEQVLFRSGLIRSLGRVDSGNSFMDCHEVERERGITVFSEQAAYRRGEDTYYLIDTPGHADFSSEMERAMEVLDYGILLVSGTDGIQGHTETIWNLLRKYRIPVFLFINKLDRDTADYEAVLKSLQERFSPAVCDMSFLTDSVGTDGGSVPEQLVMLAAEDHEEILEQYLDGTLNAAGMEESLRSMIRSGRLYPCMGGSAATGEGIDRFLQMFYRFAVTDYREEDPLRGIVYKVRHDSQGERLTFVKLTGGQISVKDSVDGEKVHQIRMYCGDRFTAVPQASAGDLAAFTGITSKKPGDGIGIGPSAPEKVIQPALRAKVLFDEEIPVRNMLEIFSILEAEDPTLHVEWEESLKQLSIHILGKIQLEILASEIEKRFGVTVSFGTPEVVYKETITEPVCGYGHFEPLRHYAEVAIRLEPGDPGSGITFRSECHVDRLAVNYQNLIRTHVMEKRHKGVLMGAELTDVTVVLTDGRSHVKHTEGGDFRESLYRAVRQGLMKANSVVLEPYYDFTITVPEEYAGRVLTDMGRYHGEFAPPEIRNHTAEISGQGPVSELMNYGEELAGFTKGRGSVSFRFSGYRPCHNQEEVVSRAAYDPDSDTENPSYSVFCSKGTSFVVNWDQAEQHMHCLRSK